MSIRIRVVDGVTVALCAARSVPQAGDVYLDDAQHEALASKFAEDFAHEGRLVDQAHVFELRRTFDAMLITEVKTYGGIPGFACTPEQMALRDAIAVLLDGDRGPDQASKLRAREESNNPSRAWWDKHYGPDFNPDTENP